MCGDCCCGVAAVGCVFMGGVGKKIRHGSDVWLPTKISGWLVCCRTLVRSINCHK